MKKNPIIAILTRLRRQEQGVAYLEFALAFPFMLLLFVGSIDVTRMVMLHQKMDKAVFTVGDLATQLYAEDGVCNTVDDWERTVVRDMIKPFPWDVSGYGFIMTSVIGDRNNAGRVVPYREWRYRFQATPASSVLGNNNPIPMATANGKGIPRFLHNPNGGRRLGMDERVIVTEMLYTFEPIMLMSHLFKIRTTRYHKASYFQSRIITGNTSRGRGNLSGCN